MIIGHWTLCLHSDFVITIRQEYTINGWLSELPESDQLADQHYVKLRGCSINFT